MRLGASSGPAGKAMLVLCALLAASDISPAMADGMMGEADILKDIIGSTMNGAFPNGGTWSEFHANDGRVLGESGSDTNSNACWTLKGDRFCYNYGEEPDRHAVCVTFERKGKDITVRWAGTERLIGIAQMEPGNPRHHGDNRPRWSCDALTSELEAKPLLGSMRRPVP